MNKMIEATGMGMVIICSWSGFAILEMCSHNAARQNMLTFSFLAFMAVLSLIGVIFVDMKNIQNYSKDESVE